MTSFWNQIDRPIIALAPMEDVTDTVLRELLLGLTDPGCLHVVMTEFVSTDGLLHKKGRPRVIHRLHVTDSERSLLKEKLTIFSLDGCCSKFPLCCVERTLNFSWAEC